MVGELFPEVSQYSQYSVSVAFAEKTSSTYSVWFSLSSDRRCSTVRREHPYIPARDDLCNGTARIIRRTEWVLKEGDRVGAKGG